jgi:hypothetical protein
VLAGRLIWGVAIVGGAGLLFLVLFGVWMFRHQESDARDRLRSWTLYGQFLFSTLLAVLICLLMIPRTISAEAGLAVLAALGGFAAGRTVGPAPARRRKTRRRGEPAIRGGPVSLHAEIIGEGPAPLSGADPVVTARYPRNRGGKP